MLLHYVSLSRILVVLVICFVFIKIYQHNLVIKLNYEKQRLEKKEALLEKQKNDLCVEYLTLREPEQLIIYAKSEWGMKAVDPAKVRVIPSSSKADFLATLPSDEVFMKLGLYELMYGHTGR